MFEEHGHPVLLVQVETHLPPVPDLPPGVEVVPGPSTSGCPGGPHALRVETHDLLVTVALVEDVDFPVISVQPLQPVDVTLGFGAIGFKPG